MQLDEYQKAAGQTAIYPDRGNNIVYPILGLVGETGEICEKLKKEIRDQGNTKLILTQSKRQEIVKEMGDVLWYLSELAANFGVTLEEVGAMNIKKLKERKEKGTLKGSGDDR
jgi:NTP pyrophosphatase (non-canonical NTP hydrolase)